MRRTLPSIAIGMAAAVSLLAACSGNSSGNNSPSSSQPSSQRSASHGPFFPECGGISDQTVSQLTQVRGLVNSARNSAGCQWLQNGGIVGPHFSFTWYRGSPIGRERKTEELSRSSVEDINIEGHSGFVAVANDPTLGDNLCEVGIQFQDDFIEWSISYQEQPFPPPCDVAKELARQSIVNAK
ncbi:MAG: DUF3558 domain-containing protein [Mycobacteriaceae bacterium]|nr:DUF3558 domain-containing protein [Mycobacteriaceae bacterium]